MIDREKIIKGLECCGESSGYGCSWCPYDAECRAKTLSGCAHLCQDALELLKEQPKIVRCKDCKHYMTIHCTCDGCCISDNWFCADGEEKQE